MQHTHLELLPSNTLRDVAITRLARALQQAGLATAPSLDDVSDMLDAFFCERDWEAIAGILAPPDMSEYRAVYKTGELARRAGSRHTDCSVYQETNEGKTEEVGLLSATVSEEAALSHLRQHMDILRLVPDAIEQQADGTLTFALNGEVLASISPIRFEAVDPVGIACVNKALKGLRETGTGAALAHRLSALPGMSALKGGAQGDSGHPSGAGMVSTLENFVVMLRTAVKEHFGLSLKQHQAQDVVATAFFGMAWQAARALADKCGEPVIREQVSVLFDTQGHTGFYRSGAGAAWGFAKRLEALNRQLDAPLYPWLLGPFEDSCGPSLSVARSPMEASPEHYLGLAFSRSVDPTLGPVPPGYEHATPLSIGYLDCQSLYSEADPESPACAAEVDLLARLYQDGPGSLLDNLRVEFLRNGTDVKHATDAALRDGCPEPLRIGTWLFTRCDDYFTDGRPPMAVLHVERIGDADTLTANSREHYFAARAALDAIIDPQQGLVGYTLKDRAENPRELPLMGLTPVDAAKLVEYAGMPA